MKSVSFVLFMTISFITTAQVTDTVFVTWRDSNAYITQRLVQENGSYSENSFLVGDTANLLNYTMQLLGNAASQLHQSAVAVIKSNKYWQQVVNEDAAYKQLYNRSPLTELQQQVDQPLLENGWELVVDSVVTDIAFNRNAQGKLRVTGIGTGAKLVDLVQNCMRVRNFSDSGAMAFYKVSPQRNVWTSVSGLYVIRKKVVRR